MNTKILLENDLESVEALDLEIEELEAIVAPELFAPIGATMPGGRPRNHNETLVRDTLES